MKIKHLKKILSLSTLLLICIVGSILLFREFSENNTEVAQKNTQPHGQESHVPTRPLKASDTTRSQINTAQQTLSNRTSGKHIDDEKLAELMEKHITPEMRQQINNMLEPDGKPPKIIKTNQGSYLDLSDRTSSVVIAVIDDGQLHVTDVMNTLPE